MPDWKDAAVILSVFLIVLGAIALAVSAQTFSVMRGKIVEKGVGVLEFGGKPRLTNTISVLIENDDRVFGIKRGTIVQYPVTEQDVQSAEVGKRVEFLVTAHTATVKILSSQSSNPA
jgi:hypothetical protein